MDTAVAEFLETGVDPAQFERVRTLIRASEVFSRDNMESRARAYGMALTSGLTLADAEGWTEALMAVTPEDVMAAAGSVFDRNRSVTGWLTGPEEAPRGVGSPGGGVEPPMTEVMQ
jgi:zinc protease